MKAENEVVSIALLSRDSVTIFHMNFGKKKQANS